MASGRNKSRAYRPLHMKAMILPHWSDEAPQESTGSLIRPPRPNLIEQPSHVHTSRNQERPRELHTHR
jgi:hypothetical protein